MVYIDDVSVKRLTFEQHKKNVYQVFDRFRAADLKLSPKNYTIFHKSVNFLGHVASEVCISTDPVVVVKNWSKPDCVKVVKASLRIFDITLSL